MRTEAFIIRGAFRTGKAAASERLRGCINTRPCGIYKDESIRSDGSAEMERTRRWVKILGGFVLLTVGVVMLITPGPGWLVIALGLGLLAAEFVWARRLLLRLNEQATRVRNRFFPRLSL